MSAACSHGTAVCAASSLDRLLRPWDGTPPLSHHPQNSRHTTRRAVKRALGTTAVMANPEVSKTSPHGRWGHANYATEPRVTKLSTPLGHDAGTPRWRCRQHSGSSKSGTGMPESSWGAGVTGFKTEVPGPSRRGLRRRKPSSDTQAPTSLGECQKLSVSPVSDHQRQAMSVIPAVRQDSDEEPRPEKPLLMDASRKWFLPAVPDVGYREEPPPQPRSPHCEGE